MVHAAVRLMVPLLLAAVGGLFTECAGVLNIALEGLMLFGAFAAVLTAAHTGSAAAAIAAAAAAAGALAFLYGLAALRLRANIFVAGIATNLLASGLTTVLADRLFGGVPCLRHRQLPVLGRGPDGGIVEARAHRAKQSPEPDSRITHAHPPRL